MVIGDCLATSRLYLVLVSLLAEPTSLQGAGVFAVVATSRAWPPSFNLNDPLLPEPGNRGANRARQWTNCGGRRVEAAAV